MESRHDSENAERILYNMRPKELVSWVVNSLAMVAKVGACFLQLFLKAPSSGA